MQLGLSIGRHTGIRARVALQTLELGVEFLVACEELLAYMFLVLQIGEDPAEDMQRNVPLLVREAF